MEQEQRRGVAAAQRDGAQTSVGRIQWQMLGIKAERHRMQDVCPSVWASKPQTVSLDSGWDRTQIWWRISWSGCFVSGSEQLHTSSLSSMSKCGFVGSSQEHPGFTLEFPEGPETSWTLEEQSLSLATDTDGDLLYLQPPPCSSPWPLQGPVPGCSQMHWWGCFVDWPVEELDSVPPSAAGSCLYSGI